MEKKNLCVEIMSGLFGPSTGKLIEASADSDEVIIEKCSAKISAFFGAERAASFADFMISPNEEKKVKILVK